MNAPTAFVLGGVFGGVLAYVTTFVILYWMERR